jgi:L,D-peptidoglycan transpeptidase YkuD (ErfK/YbiS/YcfS/YnhG family)
MADIVVYPNGRLLFRGVFYPCAIGKGGMAANKQEGDGASPIGAWAMRQPYDVQTALPVRIIHPEDGWCDAPDHPAYNTPIRFPFAASAERMWRDDTLYDLVIALGYNDDPVIAGKGSAIFMHVCRPQYRPTEGCVAVDKRHLLAMLPHFSTASRVIFSETSGKIS